MILETAGLRKAFGGTVVLDGLDLAVPEGAIYGLVGSNGAGKTTTIKLLLNIHEPDAGVARILGRDSRLLRAVDFTAIGYVSENQQLPEGMTAGEFLAFLRPLYPGWDRELEARLLDEFAIPAGRKLRHLSRGQRMKVALTSSLAYRPKVLILDEPFSGLDPLVREEFIEGLMQQAHPMTILISSHDLADVEGLVSHIGFLDQGRLQFSEEMQVLAERFRQVEVVFDDPPALPVAWPERWLGPGAASAVVRFVDSGFREDASVFEIRRLFPQARDIRVHRMNLRAIFIALAKQSRAAHQAAVA